MTSPLRVLARHHGLTLDYDDPETGQPRPVPEATLRLILKGLGVNPDSAPQGPAAPDRMEVPQDARCWLPPKLDGAPGWGLFCQLYELRSARNWGIGDFADLTQLARIAGAAGADFLGVNPLHALFTADPGRVSPFSPSNRRFLNPLYIAPDLIPGAVAPAALSALRDAEEVDYPAVARIKLQILRAIFAADPFAAGPETDLDAFIAEGGAALYRHALFEALSHQMVSDGHGPGWHGWPEALRDPDSAAVETFARDAADEVRFHLWLQWVARGQLRMASDAARRAGMRIGLYLDLAVGEAPDGSSTWSGAAAALPDLSIGAPPDMFAVDGQNWGLAAPSPTALEQSDFAPFRAMIAAQMADAGALRIDHVMALWQLFLIPTGETPAAGTHLRMPFADLVRTLAQQSRENAALVIGEDLGFVPDGFRAAMEQARILSYRILYFEQDEQGFRLPEAYPDLALACVSTHDLPVLRGWWRGEDIALREEHGLVDPETSAAHLRNRAGERSAMARALRQAGVLPASVQADAPDLPDEVLDAAHLFLARTPARLVGVRLADLAGPAAPTNLPGTVDSYPNWRPRSPVPLEVLADHAPFARLTALMCAERPRPPETE